MFFRGRGLTFWLLFTTFLYLVATRPVDTADALIAAVLATIRFLRSVGHFFDALRT
ncbi:hypothetical protein [Streptomyces sp. NPDC005876]|jgi:hypothetical protein|uniref:hypothetical protein n=1 Tax=unclassified Streptomyces TaxID=2593676 RepID=UPI0034017028